MNRVSAPVGKPGATAPGAWPSNTYFPEEKDIFFNDEAVMFYHDANAHTDGDTIVFFRRSDVVVAGDIFVTTSYPVIDAADGGSVQGVIAGLNRILDLAVPKHEQEGGTMVIPGHGKLSDESEVLEYRDMVVIIKERIEDMVKRGMTVEQVKAAKPSLDYDLHYGAETGPWTTAMFIEAVYRDVSKRGGETGRGRGEERAGAKGEEMRVTLKFEGKRQKAKGKFELHAVFVLRLTSAFCLLPSYRGRPTARRATDGEGGGGVRSHRVLGSADHGRLALPHGDAAEGRLRQRAAHRRRPPRRRHLGPRQGRRRRQSVQGVRCRRHPPSARPAAHHLGERQHAEDGVRRGSADAAPALRQRSASRREDMAGIFLRRVGRAARRRSWCSR